MMQEGTVSANDYVVKLYDRAALRVADAKAAADAKPLFTEEDLIQEYADTAEQLGYDFVFFDLRELTLPEIYELHIENGYWSFEDAVEYGTKDQHKLNYHKQYAA